MTSNYLLIFLLIGIAVLAQTLLKLGMKKIGVITEIKMSNLGPLILKMISNFYVPIGIFLYAMGSFLWLVLLSRLELSFLYPFGSLEYFFIFLVSYIIFKEKIKIGRIIGVIFIILGIFVISKFGINY